MDTYPTCLLLKLPHQNEYCHNCLIDSGVYQEFTQAGWKFTISEPTAGKPYVKMYRNVDGQFQQYWLHRYMAMGTLKCGHVMHVHHIDGSGLNNQCDNLIVLHPSYHRRLHARSREVSQ